MPTTYAHFTFGKQVYKQLDDEMKQLIDRHPSMFLTGLHGPDFLFYYKPLRKNHLVKLGHDIHQQKAALFFENARKKLPESRSREAAIAYLLGFYCHYILDRECHPLVRKVAGTDKAAHNQLEKEFDRTMMLRDGLDPISFKPTWHLALEPADAVTVSAFYPGVPAVQIEKAVRDMKRFLEILVTPGKLKYSTLKLIFYMTGRQKSLSSLLMSMKPISEYEQVSGDLADCLADAVQPTATSVRELYMYVMSDNNQPIPKKLEFQLGRNFG